MLFNSYEFIFLFLPITLLIFYQLGERGYYRWAIAWLVAASLWFYGQCNPAYLGLLLFSIVFNYILGRGIAEPLVSPLSRKLLLIFGITVNLAVLGYFKYANFLVDSINDWTGTRFVLKQMILPLAISFFTFEQISYLVDSFKGKIQAANFLQYCFYLSFFPKLIAGPIVRYQELIPQLEQKACFRFDSENLAVGLTLFSFGLFKKVILADSLAPHVTLVYRAVAEGTALTFFEAWTGLLAQSLQLYFDFSGYSDMATGIARLFGLKLVLNFNSPYKAANMSQFWSRWHMSLTRFFRDYLYFPLSRWLQSLSLAKDKQRSQQRQTYLNTIITMTLTGIWHGAGWNFLAWGALHGVYLVIHQRWREWQRALGQDLRQKLGWRQWLGWLLTFLAWAFALVLTRTDNPQNILTLWQGMAGLNKISLPGRLTTYLAFLPDWEVQFNGLMPNLKVDDVGILARLSVLLLVVWFAPNTQQWMGQYRPALDHYVARTPVDWKIQLWKRLQWQPVKLWAIFSALLTLIAISSLAQEVEFIYFQF